MKTKNIKLYSTTTCPYCIMEKQWLDANKIAHEVIYVDKDENEARKMIRNTGQMGVPVTEISEENGNVQYVIGFDQVRLNQLINS